VVFANETASFLAAAPLARRYEPLPTGQRKREKGLKTDGDWGPKNGKNKGRQAFDRPFDLGFGLCFEQNA
jgi:hypothetical protein